MNNINISQDMTREDSGKFAVRYDEPKTLRSIRLTDSAWQALKDLGEANDHISRTDVIERFVRQQRQSEEIILKALNTFIEDEKADWGSNPMQKGEFKFSRAWDKLLKFKELLESAPWEVIEE